MSEERAPYLYTICPTSGHQSLVENAPHTVKLGEHILELLDSQGAVQIYQPDGQEYLQLDAEESYRLLRVLQDLFRKQAEQLAKSDDDTGELE